MNIVMLTNTYLPHVGGVARSVAAFASEYRRRGHRVLIVAPEFDDQPKDEHDVVRIPAIQHFNGSDFSAVLPMAGLLTDTLDEFQPDIVHSHHPYLLGITALRIARYRELPLVFTHHTLYEQYTHYVPLDSLVFRRFVIEFASRYANLCDEVFAPSESIAALLHKRGVTAPVSVVPTGVDAARFAVGDGASFRKQYDIPEDAFVIGHLGRLAPEKNLKFLAESMVAFVACECRAHVLLVGEGPSKAVVQSVFAQQGFADRLHVAGILRGSELTNAYHAMDVFAFASKSETQGMVLTEAMAAGVPVVGLDAPGVREVVQDKHNGRLLLRADAEGFWQALQWVANQPKGVLQHGALATAAKFSIGQTAERALTCYESLRNQAFVSRPREYDHWAHMRHLIQAEWQVLQGVAGAASAALGDAENNSQASS